MLATGVIGGANPIAAPVIGTATMAIALLRLLLVRYTTASLRVTRLFLLDFMLHDIPPDEEEQSHGTRLPRQHIRIDSWTEQECYDFTSLTWKPKAGGWLEDEEWPKIAQLYDFVEGVSGCEGVREESGKSYKRSNLFGF